MASSSHPKPQAGSNIKANLANCKAKRSLAYCTRSFFQPLLDYSTRTNATGSKIDSRQTNMYTDKQTAGQS
jgi:hypothetical protein